MVDRKHEPLNPYIAGSALDSPEGFFGREDILRLVETELRSPHQNAVVLFGQRRIGKTSILLQLQRRLRESGFVPVYLDLMDRARRPLGKVLAELADNVALELGLDPPEPDRFDDEGLYFHQGFLPVVYEALGEDEAERRPVFLFDEFDVLDAAMSDELPETAAARTFFDYLRELMGQEKRLGFVIVVGRKTEELSTNFLATFRAARYQKVSVLKEDDARALIQLADKADSLRYTSHAITRILALTAGHPYFTQLTCFLLFNHAWTGDGDDVPQVGKADVDAIVPRVLEAGNNAFEWVWDGLPPAERIIFSAIAQGTDEGQVLNEDQIVAVLQQHGIRILIRELELAPRTLVEWEMLHRVDGGYRFFIELMRRWVARNKPLSRVRDELDRVDVVADGFFRLGMTFYRQENFEAATDQLREALTANPNHLQARLLLGTCLREQGDLEGAVKEFEWAYAYDAQASRYELVRTLLQRGALLEQEDDEDEALEAYERILKVSPRERVASERRAAIYVRRGDAALANQEFEAALSDYGQADAEEKRLGVLRSWLQSVSTLEAVGDEDTALEQYQRILSHWPERREAVEGIAAIWVRRGDAALAVDDLDSALESYEMAGVQEKIDDVATRRQRRELETQAQRGEVAESAEDWETAVEVYEKLVAQDPDDPRWGEALEQSQREQWLDVRYRAGLGAVEQEQWALAQRALADVAFERPDYKETSRYLHLAVGRGREVQRVQVEPKNIWERVQRWYFIQFKRTPAWVSAAGLSFGLGFWLGVVGMWFLMRGQTAPQPTVTPTQVVVVTPTETPTPTLTALPTVTLTPTSTSTSTPTGTATPTSTPTPTATPTPTSTASPTSGPTPVLVAGATRVWEKDGSVMIYVPSGKFWMGSDEDDSLAGDDEKPQREISLDAFWIGRTEVTNGQYRLCVDDGGCSPPSSPTSYARTLYYGDPAFDNYPVIWVNWDQANAYCTWTGNRLPMEAEWEKAARGADGRIYLWGDEFDGSRLNFCDDNCDLEWKDFDSNDGHMDTAPVGSYLAGTSPYDVLDMAGNVWEWVADWYDGGYYAISPDSNPQGPESGDRRVVRGGAWGSAQRYVRVAVRNPLEPVKAGNDVGFRCAQLEAEPLQPTLTPPPADTPTATLTPTPSAMPTPTGTSTPTPAPVPVAPVDKEMVRIPGGEFMMGSSDGDPDEAPPHLVSMAPFWMDITEVTNDEFAALMQATGYQAPAIQLGEGNHPVSRATWDDATAYCAWAGKRLPTEAEWEFAARGTDGRVYPWGNDWDPARANGRESGIRGTTAVGSFGAGASPFGVLDMAGNVREWTAGWYDRYPGSSFYSPYFNQFRVHRGGGWFDDAGDLRAANRNGGSPESANDDLGFRCVRSDSGS